MQKFKPLLLIIISLLSYAEMYAQISDEYHEIKTISDEYYYGKLIFADTTTLSFITHDNIKLNFKIEEIKYMKLTDKIKVISEGRSRIYSSQALYGETAIPIKKNTLYYSSSFIFDNRFRFAFNDFINIEAGNNPFLKDFESTFFPYLGIKANVTLVKNKLHIATKFSQFLLNIYPYYYYEDKGFESKKMSMWSSMLTLGDKEAAITFSFNRSFNYRFDYFNYYDRDIFQFGGYIKVSKRNYFNVESIRLSKTKSFTMVGIRHDRYSTSFTYGVLYYSNEEGYKSGMPLPYFSLRVPIESK